MKCTWALLMIPLTLNAWSDLSGYPERVLAVNGDQIETTGSFKNHVELAYAPKRKLYGISFYNYKNMDDQVVIPSGSFTIRGCNKAASGVIEGVDILMKNDDEKNFEKIMKCQQVLFLRVYDDFENYATYRIEKTI